MPSSPRAKNGGQREARTVERSWGRSVPAVDPDDPASL